MKKSAAVALAQVPAAIIIGASARLKKSTLKRAREIHGKPVLVVKRTEEIVAAPVEVVVKVESAVEIDVEAEDKHAETVRQLSQGSENARRDRVVLEHLALVRAIAVRVHENLPVHVDLDDLVHAGILGLFDAASKFNPDKQVVFSSYAKHRIKGAILDSLRQLDWASRDLRRRHKQVEAVTRELLPSCSGIPPKRRSRTNWALRWSVGGR